MLNEKQVNTLESLPRVGIMQGRLLRPVDGNIQAFPEYRWRDEFAIAREAQLYCIEWIYDQKSEKNNPLSTKDGILEMQRLTREFEIHILSVCADYYMSRRLIDGDGSINEKQAGHLFWLINQIESLGGIYVVLPFVDSSSLITEAERNGVTRLLERIIPQLEQTNIEVHLETDLTPKQLSKLIARVDHPLILINYDIGNSASLGHDTIEEISLVGQEIGSVHVKDRIFNGGTVPLGQGDADLPASFRMLRNIGFDRWFILQAARESRCTELELAIENRKLIEQHYAIGSVENRISA